MRSSRAIASARVEIVEADLPGACAATCCVTDDVVWIVVDPSKPDAYRQADEMLRTERPLASVVLSVAARRRTTPTPAPAPRRPLGRFTGIAALVLTGAGIVLGQIMPVADLLA